MTPSDAGGRVCQTIAVIILSIITDFLGKARIGGDQEKKRGLRKYDAISLEEGKGSSTGIKDKDK